MNHTWLQASKALSNVSLERRNYNSQMMLSIVVHHRIENPIFIGALERLLMYNTYYEHAGQVLSMLEQAVLSRRFSQQFYEIMFGHCISLLDSGSSHDLIKLYDLMETQGKVSLPPEVIEKFKKYLAEEIDEGLSLHEITKFLKIYKDDKQFTCFILAKALEQLQSGSQVKQYEMLKILGAVLDFKDLREGVIEWVLSSEIFYQHIMILRVSGLLASKMSEGSQRTSEMMSDPAIRRLIVAT